MFPCVLPDLTARELAGWGGLLGLNVTHKSLTHALDAGRRCVNVF